MLQPHCQITFITFKVQFKNTFNLYCILSSVNKTEKAGVTLPSWLAAVKSKSVKRFPVWCSDWKSC